VLKELQVLKDQQEHKVLKELQVLKDLKELQEHRVLKVLRVLVMEDSLLPTILQLILIGMLEFFLLLQE
jgi:hypothetical protein